MGFWRKTAKTKPPPEPPAEPNGTVEHQEFSGVDEVTGIHRMTMDMLRSELRGSIAELIDQLDEVKRRAEEIVHSGDLPRADRR